MTDQEVILKDLIERARTNYMCNRGPRPSGAMLRVIAGYLSPAPDVPYLDVFGNVGPTINSSSCIDDGCMMVDGHCVRNIHAEVDALLSAAHIGFKTKGGHMYSINKPCYNCTIACIKAGISKIYYAYAVYDEERTQLALKAADVECIHVQLDV